jgi:hypothetical protein
MANKQFRVDVGTADGKAGDTLTVSAPDVAGARVKALASDQMRANPTWTVTGVWEKAD